MSRPHTPEYKQLACQLLQTNGGNIELTSRQTGIPPRTLREWRQRYVQPLPEEESRRRQSIEDQFQFLRERMMEQAIALALTLTTETDAALLNLRITALTRLVDRIVKLQTDSPEQEMTIRVVREDKLKLKEGDEMGSTQIPISTFKTLRNKRW